MGEKASFCGNALQYEEIGGTLYPPQECIGIKNAGFMPVYDTTGALQTGQKTIQGSGTLSAGGTLSVTLTGVAVFTSSSSSSYTCSVTDKTTAAAWKVAKASGSQFTITGGANDAIDYRCVGN